MIDPLADVLAIVGRTVDINTASWRRIADAHASFKRDAERAQSVQASLRVSLDILQDRRGVTSDGIPAGSASSGTCVGAASSPQ